MAYRLLVGRGSPFSFALFDRYILAILSEARQANAKLLFAYNILSRVEKLISSYACLETRFHRSPHLSSLINKIHDSKKSAYALHDSLQDLLCFIGENSGDLGGHESTLRLICKDVRKCCFPVHSSTILKNRPIIIQEFGWGGSFGHQSVLLQYFKAFAHHQLLHDSLDAILIDPADSCVQSPAYQELIIEYASRLPNCNVVLSKRNIANQLAFHTDHMDVWPFIDGSLTLISSLDRVNRLLPDTAQLQLAAPYLEKGLHMLDELGIPLDSKLITVQIRSSTVGGKIGIARNASISSYRQAIDFLVESGFYVFVICDSFVYSDHRPRKLVDYTKNPLRNAVTDLFLLATSYLYIGNLSGPLEVATTFNTPCLLTNAPQFAGSASVFRPNTLLVPRFIRDLNSMKLQSFSETLGSYPGYLVALDNDSSYQYIHNSSIDLLNATKDILCYLAFSSDHRNFSLDKCSLNQKLNIIREMAGVHLNLPVAPSLLKNYEHLLC